jgi:hypothetical protein
MGIRVEVICEGPHIRDLSVIQGDNSLTVGLLDWWDTLTNKSKLLGFAAPNSEMEVAAYGTLFGSLFGEAIPHKSFPLFDQTEVDDFQDNVKHLKELGYTPPVLKGRLTLDPKSFRIFNDGWKERT